MDTIDSKLHKVSLIPPGGGGLKKLMAELKGLGASRNILLALAEAEEDGWAPEYSPRGQNRPEEAYRFTDDRGEPAGRSRPGALPGELFARLTLGEPEESGRWYPTLALAWEDLGRAIRAVYGPSAAGSTEPKGEGPVPPGELP